MCLPGELTDKGRETTLALGQRLRHLYIDQLRFMPKLISDSDMIYIRATPIQRAFESVQQAFTGFYPPSARTADFPTPTIIQRASADETLYPNEGACRRFAVLSRAFAQRAAERWNDTEDMQYLSKKISKYMPGGAKVAVDSHPRLSGIMDTLNATDAHGPVTKLPKEFYDPKVRAITDKIAVEEWNAGYTESLEYRMLGVGGLMGDIASRMTGSAQRNDHDGVLEVGGQGGKTGQGRRGKTDLKLALSGCHDTTLSGVLTSLGAFDGEKWPPFTSHIAFEMFRKRSAVVEPAPVVPSTQGWWSSIFTSKPTTEPTPESISRTPTTQVSASQKSDLTDYYVRIRYNDKIMQVPGCKAAGKHLDGDTTFCTLVSIYCVDVYCG
jgi:acid phosphatase